MSDAASIAQEPDETTQGVTFGGSGEGQYNPAKVNDEEEYLKNVRGHGEYRFTHEEIEKNRLITLDRDGKMKVSKNEDVIKTLEYVHCDNSAFLHDEPHFTNENEKRSIIGPDNRYTVRTQSNAPYSAIGYLSGGCTSYLVGPRHLVTAAHCLHPTGNTRGIYAASRINFYLQRNCYTSGTRYNVSEVLVYSQYMYFGNNDYDIACLLLNSTVSNWMGYAYRDPMPTVTGEICGYPSDITRTYNCFRCSSCTDVQRAGWWIFRNDNRLQYTCDTEGGMSGSPVMTDEHDSTRHQYSYGVHTTGSSTSNEGVRITRNYFYDICRWKCNTGATCSAVC